MLAASPDRRDQDARALRERLELLALGDDDRACAEAARQLVAFVADHPEYRLCAMIPESAPVVEGAPRKLASQYDGRCNACRSRYSVGDLVWWTSGKSGALCVGCGGKP